MERESRVCKNCSSEFPIESDDLEFYKKIQSPLPTQCPHCRMIRRFLFRNERSWYRRLCAATGKPVLSMYHPDLPLTVYEENYWKSDAWDPLDYGREYDFSRGFFEQFFELFTAVPHPNLIQKNNVESDYSNHTLNLKNCYFCISTDTAEDSSYLFTAMIRMRNSFDGHQSSDSEYCYEIVDSKKCNRILFAQNCEGCVESALLYDCRNCTNCFGSVGLRGAQYMIFNEQYSKDDYHKKVSEYWNGSFSALQNAFATFNELKLAYPHKYAMITNSQNVSGDDIYNARNCSQCFFARDNVENCKYCYRVWENTKDGWDGIVVWKGSEVFYEVLSVTGQRIFFSAYVWGGNDIEYSYNCFDCNNVFGCIGLRSKSYCIFNRQYSKEEYLVLVQKIKDSMKEKGEYGEFFPISFSPFAYNETIAQDYFPITKALAIERGLPWRDNEEKHYTITLTTETIPDTVSEVTDAILKDVIACAHQGICTEQCSTAFRITAEELQFYKMLKVPLPRLCPNCRHFARVKMKTPLKLWHRSCMCTKDTHDHVGNCSNEFETAYATDRPEIVYCESCYQREIL
jgi:hypothetical protein